MSTYKRDFFLGYMTISQWNVGISERGFMPFLKLNNDVSNLVNNLAPMNWDRYIHSSRPTANHD